MKKVKNGIYSCKYCPRTFKYFKNFQVHEETQACLTKFSCKHCGKKLSSNENLQKHEMIHTGEKPHKCKNCDMCFVSINSLKRHELVHTGAKPYSCQYCEKTFRCEISVFVSSNSVKLRELSFAQIVYFLGKVCLFFNFWMIKFTIMSNKT